MCRMMGMIGTPPLPLKEALDAFYPLCTKGRTRCDMKTPGHLDGWGISGFSRGRAVYFDRRAAKASEERPLYDKAIDKAKASKTQAVIAHFRKSSLGNIDVCNTHPFHYHDWVFAHNGTIFNAEALVLEETPTQGETDSERFMLWMMPRLVSALEPTEMLVDLIREAREKLTFSSLTFLLTDGKTFWAYREVGDKNLGPGESAPDREAYYTLHFARVGDSFVVCSEILAGLSNEWRAIGQKSLAVITAAANTPKIVKV